MERITIIGNTGSGKTTLGSRLQKIAKENSKITAKFFEEPVKSWFYPHNYVAEIQKRSENALISQVYILNTLRDREDEIKEFIRDGKNSSSVVENCHSNKTIAIIEQIM